MAPWGDNNLFPQEVIEDLRKSTQIAPILDLKARMLYQGGLEYGTVTYDDKGREIFRPAKDPRVEEFNKRSNIPRFLIQSCKSLYTFYNNFPEYVLTKDRSEIAFLTMQRPEYCRWALQNEQTGAVDWCYINANWERGGKADDQLTHKVAVIDPYFDPITATREGDFWKYIYPVSYPTPGTSLYQLADWNVVRVSGWFDVAKKIPEFKKALFDNQLSIKYLIEISQEWWKVKFKDWDQKTEKQQLDLMQKELDNFTAVMTGTKGAGKAVMGNLLWDPVSRKEYSGWKITAVDDKVKNGMYIEDSHEASSHIITALGLDPTLIGNGPGKNMGAGSGSDKRVAFNMHISNSKIHEDTVLEPLQFAYDYNGFADPKTGLPYQVRFRRSLITTLDAGKEVETQAA